MMVMDGVDDDDDDEGKARFGISPKDIS